jgi:enterobacterial common antigen flippase
MIRTKIVAELLGPAGTAVLSQLSNIGSIGGVLATLGVPGAIVQRIAAADGRGDAAGGPRTVATATALSTSLAVAVALGMAALIPWLLPLLGGGPHGPTLLLLSAGSVTVGMVGTLAISALNGRRLTRATVTAGVVGSVLAAALSLPLTWGAGLLGAAVAALSAALGSTGYALWALRRKARDLYAAHVAPRRYADRAELRALCAFGIPSVMAGFVPFLMQLSARTIMIDRAGVDAAGLFQSAMSFSQQYAGLFLGSIGVYLMPTVSATTTAQALSDETERSLVLLLQIGTPIILIAIAAHDIILPIAYSRRFLGAGPQLEVQLAADVLKIVSWHFGITLVARAEMRAFLILEVLGAATFVAIMWVFVRTAPTIAGGLATLGLYGVYTPTSFFFARARCGLRLGAAGIRAIAVSVAAASAGVALTLTCGRIGHLFVAVSASGVLVFLLRRLAADGALQATPLGRFFKPRR